MNHVISFNEEDVSGKNIEEEDKLENIFFIGPSRNLTPDTSHNRLPVLRLPSSFDKKTVQDMVAAYGHHANVDVSTVTNLTFEFDKIRMEDTVLEILEPYNLSCLTRFYFAFPSNSELELNREETRDVDDLLKFIEGEDETKESKKTKPKKKKKKTPGNTTQVNEK